MIKEYYVSRTSFIILAVIICGYIALVLWSAGRMGSTLVWFRLLVLVPILFVLPRRLRLLRLLRTGTPALCLTPDALEVNITGKTYPWKDIKEIRQRSSVAGRGRPSDILVTMADDSTVSITAGSLEATLDDILGELNQYQKRYGRA
ncbi:hypothetical protein [Dinghuibacter silviterrae]|uniref:PH (Pleckstrin Homology) domain-containing protein n=1 Tax=Dinghuibacter silviterrae TaxID=1539049 RepID=A0A4V3GKW1_9BACT|nr:hypothetical protein [Dinghuibacter silviterrae]TDW97202.1 hypothetical protein EDB95_5047 [Dinghuibacter silviterrae]